jgi:hypothetical protein
VTKGVLLSVFVSLVAFAGTGYLILLGAYGPRGEWPLLEYYRFIPLILVLAFHFIVYRKAKSQAFRRGIVRGFTGMIVIAIFLAFFWNG